MHASSVALAAAALVAPAFAQLDPMNLGNPFIAPDETNEPTVGKPFTVKWTPTLNVGVPPKECNLVKIDLLYGQSSATLEVNSTIANNIVNTGEFVWTPASTLAAEEAHYGLKISCVPSGYYQYTRLFGLKAGAVVASSTSSLSAYSASTTASSTHSASGSSTADATGSSTTGQETIWTTEVVSHLTTYCPAATTMAFNQVTYTITEPTMLTVTDCPCTVSYTKKPETTAAAVTHTPYPIPHANTTMVLPTGSVSPAVSVAVTTAAAVNEPTADATAPITPAGSEGAASGLKATALGAFIAVAVAVLAL